MMRNRKIKVGMMLFLLIMSILTNGQSKKQIIEDGWWYLDSFDNFKRNENIELVKNWLDEKVVCVVSFEEGLFTIDGESPAEHEKGTLRIKKTGNKRFLFVSNENALIYKFEVMSVERNKLRLKKLE